MNYRRRQRAEVEAADASMVAAVKRTLGVERLTLPLIRPLAYTDGFNRMVAETYGVAPERAHLRRGWEALLRECGEAFEPVPEEASDGRRKV